MGQGVGDRAAVPRRRRRLIASWARVRDRVTGRDAWADPALALLVAALIIDTAFNGGGFFAGTPAVAVALLCVALMLRITVAEEPFAGIGSRLLVPIAALALYAVWVLVSAAWSHAPGRATIEFDRALFYLLLLVLFGSWPSSPGRSRWVVRGIAVAFVTVCGVALVSRLLPDVLHTAPRLHSERLGFPLTYWNALGLMAAVGIVLCLHLASSMKEPAVMRVFGAGALPLLCTVLFFTFSRGAIAAAVIGTLVFAVLGRSRSLPLGLLAGAPAAAVAVAAAYGAKLLAEPHLGTPAATTQGHGVALVVVACVFGAVVVRGGLCLLERRLAHAALPFRAGRAARLGGLAVLLVALIGTAGVLKLPSRVSLAAQQFTHGSPAVTTDTDVGSRLGNASNNGRLDLWRVSLDSFRSEPLLGKGAGTFQSQWQRSRPYADGINDGHSLYIETLGELGVVGGVLIVVLVGALLIGLSLRSRRTEGTAGAALAAAGLAWALHAGIDWDWEMPAVTLWVFAAAGTLLAAPPSRADAGDHAKTGAKPLKIGRRARVLGGIACLIVAVTPVRVAISQAQLNRSVAAYKRGECGTAIGSALSSISAFAERPDPYQIVAFCDLRLGRPDLALPLMRQAVSLDPNDSGVHYGLSLVRAAMGQDPRPEAQVALRLNPLGELPRDAVRRFASDSARSWERGARSAPLSLGP